MHLLWDNEKGCVINRQNSETMHFRTSVDIDYSNQSIMTVEILLDKISVDSNFPYGAPQSLQLQAVTRHAIWIPLQFSHPK
jgi:hypothetical protein